MEIKNNIKYIIIGIVFLMIFLIIAEVFLFTGFTVKEDSEELKIGVIAPLSGDFVIVGGELQKGIEIAKDDLKLNKKVGYKIIYEDDKFSTTESVNAANKLINFDQIDIGITPFIEGAKPVVSIFNNKKIPLIVAWDSTHLVNENEYLFSTGFSTEKAGEKMAEFSYKELGLKKIVVVSHKEAWSELISGSFKNKFKELGGEINYHFKHDVEDKDYRSTILKIKKSNADAVYMPLIPPNNVNFLKQAKELDLNIQLLEGDALFIDSINDAGETSEGVYYTNIFTEESEILTKKYKKKYNSDPLDITIVSFGYQVLKTIAKAHEKNSNDLREGLFDVIGGKTLNRVENIYVVKNGKPVLVEG